MHLWIARDYPTSHNFGTSGAGPEAGTGKILTTSNSFGTLTLLDGAISSAGYPNGTTPILTGTLEKTMLPDNRTSRCRIYNVTKTFTNCPVTDVGDLAVNGVVWAAQDDNGKNIACINSNLSFLPPVTNNFSVQSAFFCTKPDNTRGRQYKLDLISNNTPTSPLSVSYKSYVDNGDKAFVEAEETLFATVSGVSISSSNSYTTNRVGYEPYSSSVPEANRSLWFNLTVTTSTGNVFTRLEFVANDCVALPVKYNYFNVSRNAANRQQVDLVWETSMEQNNQGFQVQRKTDGDWRQLALVASAAEKGNSSTPILYRFRDHNYYRGNSQYRLLQVDFDGKTAYSDVKSVGGADMGQTGVLVFPNPATNGMVTLLFPEAAKRNIILSDGAGKVLQQFRNHNGNSLTIERLKPGFYIMKISEEHSGKTFAEKIIVQ